MNLVILETPQALLRSIKALFQAIKDVSCVVDELVEI